MEGPSLVILREEIQHLVGHRIRTCASAVNTVSAELLRNQELKALQTWGKHFLFCFDNFTVKIHFLMFGSYRIDEERPDKTPKLTLVFPNGTIHLYSCAVQVLNEPIDTIYDWRVDLMSDAWDHGHVRRLLNKQGASQLGDVLLDQTIFAGAGNIIKNEVLFNLKLNPEQTLATIPRRKWTTLVRKMRAYCIRFYEWKKAFLLKKNWQIYRKRICPLCQGSVTMKKTGKLARVSFYCPNCQPLKDV